MKKADITPISELDRIKGENTFVRMPQNGKNYTCHLRNGEGIRLTTRVRPQEYPVHGTFYSEDGTPRIGVQMQKKLMRGRGLSVVGDDNCLIYGRSFDSVPATPEALRAAVKDFLRDVSQAVPEVNKAVLEYINRVDQAIKRDLKKY